MIIYLFSNSMVALILGNIFGLIKKILKKEEQVIWVSQIYYKHYGHKDYLFIILWTILAISVGYFFISFPGYQGTPPYYIGSFFFITGILLASRLPHALTRLHIYSNQLEKKILLHTTYKIPFNSIESVFEDPKGFAKITYHDKTFGLLALDKEPWRIPMKVFMDHRLNLPSSKLHLNIKTEDYNKFNVSKELTAKDIGILDKILIASVFIFNPYSLILGFVFIFGIFFTSPLLFFLTDLSKTYCSFVLRLLPTKQNYRTEINAQ